MPYTALSTFAYDAGIIYANQTYADDHPAVSQWPEQFLEQGSDGGGSVPAWIANADYPETYPASPHAMDDEFDDSDSMSGSENGLDDRWSWRNQGGATISYPSRGWATINVPSSGGENWRIIEQSSIPDGTYEMAIESEGVFTGDRYWGFVLVDSANGDLAFIGLGVESAVTYLMYQRKTNVTTHASALAASQTINGSVYAEHPKYLRLVRAGTAMELWIGYTGRDWRRMATFTEDVGATRIGIGAQEKSSTGLFKVHVDYFRKVA